VQKVLTGQAEAQQAMDDLAARTIQMQAEYAQ